MTSTTIQQSAITDQSLSDKDRAFIRLASAILGQPEEILLADFLAKKLGKAS
tara:strand:+ start:3525 stop:3680 length:156 start_codon:yes stop_codon:yes gene_type:complete